MAKIPNANVEVAAMYANCPECGESFQRTQDNSMLLSTHNFDAALIGTVTTCFGCGSQYRLPASLRKVFR